MASTKITIHSVSEENAQKINRHIYGHFAEHLGRCIYGGIWVGEDSPIPNTRGIRNDIVEAMRKIKAPNLRWPGGCFADTYNWRDGIGPKADRTRILNFWGDTYEDNSFGTHEFMDLCEQIGCDAYIAGNVGGGTPREMRDWIEYLTSDSESTLANQRRQNGRDKAWAVPFWGVGNENWGCGGHMTPEYYGDLYCQFQNFIRNYSDTPMKKIAAGYGGSDTEGEDMEKFMAHITNRRFPVRTDGVSVHFYVYLRHDEKHSSTDFGDEEWFDVMKFACGIEETIEKNIAVLDRYDPEKNTWLIVDEWGTWYPGLPGTNPAFLEQQNSMRDAVVAALTLHIFQDYCERVQIATIAQTVNVLQAMILTEDEKMILTPTYHVFDMFKGHQDATRLPLEVETTFYPQGVPQVSASASRSESGEILLTLCNLSPKESSVITCDFSDVSASNLSGVILVGDEITAHNTFDAPDRVQPQAFSGAKLEGHTLTVDLPAASVVAITLS